MMIRQDRMWGSLRKRTHCGRAAGPERVEGFREGLRSFREPQRRAGRVHFGNYGNRFQRAVRSAECRMPNAECGVRSAECGPWFFVLVGTRHGFAARVGAPAP